MIKNIKKILYKQRRGIAIVVIPLLVWYYFSLPKVLFETPKSTVVTAKGGQLLGAVIAADGQWRFPELDSVPIKFKQCIIQFEDAYFYKHIGFNPISIGKALKENLKENKVVRGGSTLTQQVIRLSRKLKKRTYFEKFVELILATRLELQYSKSEILNLYASNAPFGGNVVGLEMAAWRYFGLHPNNLSWAETATLAVLPNAPSLIYPGKNQVKLKQKRDRLLHKLYKKQIIDSITYVLATEERLPQKPYPLPKTASHFVQEVVKAHKGKRIHSSIDLYLQKKINSIAKRHYQLLKQNEVFNMAILVLDVSTRKVVAYVGNSPTDEAHQKHVNNVIAARSTGSTLKPFLYAHALKSGDLLPSQLLKDIPTYIAGYVPKNFDLSYDGAVPANEALTRSLNIPAVRLLQHYGLDKFRQDLKDYEVTSINKSSEHYGLSLILGGGEVTLWDLCRLLAGYSGTINHFNDSKGKYRVNEFKNPSYILNEPLDFGPISDNYTNIDAGSAFLTLDALTNVNRPQIDQAWRYYDSSQKIGWKTGTSFGNKDAWAIGTTPKYVVGVWVGNSDGEGRPDMTGLSSAAPVMFDVFEALPKTKWFTPPVKDLTEELICEESGHLALPICPSSLKWIPKAGLRSEPCPYHKEILLDKKERLRVNSNCESINEMVPKTCFVLPTLEAHYYQKRHSNYEKLPDFKKGCIQEKNMEIDFLYPIKYHSKISLTRDNKDNFNPLVLKATHKKNTSNLYWYIDEVYLKKTESLHEVSILPTIGKHIVMIVDDEGNEAFRSIEIF